MHQKSSARPRTTQTVSSMLVDKVSLRTKAVNFTAQRFTCPVTTMEATWGNWSSKLKSLGWRRPQTSEDQSLEWSLWPRNKPSSSHQSATRVFWPDSLQTLKEPSFLSGRRHTLSTNSSCWFQVMPGTLLNSWMLPMGDIYFSSWCKLYLTTFV